MWLSNVTVLPDKDLRVKTLLRVSVVTMTTDLVTELPRLHVSFAGE